MENKTQVNPAFNSNATVVNPGANNSTEVNYAVNGTATELVKGDSISGKYVIVEKLSSSGEADLYICEYNGNKYVAKIYRRESAVKADVVEALKKINSPYIVELIDSDTFNGKPYEILPYYKNGSLQGKTFSFDVLKNNIIPSINEALRVLHTNSVKIIHKDLKPSNIMMLDDGNVAIIDFGVSSAINDGNTMLVTKTGMTPEYSAPEALKQLFLEESDYYSFGITIYELFCGHTPYHGMSQEDMIRYSSIQQLPFPGNMPKALKDLITALTYNDLTHRNDSNNPNRRWTYQDVLNWCKGKDYVLPGEGVAAFKQASIPSYSFLHQKYDNVPELIRALSENWEEGKKQLFRGLLSGFFKSFDPEIAGYCLDAEDESNAANSNDDLIFFKLLYKMQPDLRKFYWKGKIYDSLPDLGKEMLGGLWADENANNPFWNSILEFNLISEYLSTINMTNKDLLDAVRALESSYIYNNKSQRDRTMLYYQTAYLLSGVKELHIEGKVYTDVSAVAENMKTLLEKSFEDFEAFCKLLINENNDLNPQFEAWLIAIGKQKEIEKWKKSLR